MRVPTPDGLRIVVTDGPEALAQAAAAMIIDELKRRPDLLLCASAGGTPTATYRELAVRGRRNPSLFARMRVLQIDEWGGLPKRCPATCEADLRMKLLDPLQIGANRFVAWRSAAPDPQREARSMAAWLAAHGPIDICLLGLGLNGHIAMNEPADALEPHAHVATLAGSSQQHAMLGELARKPRYGLTLGLSDILRSRKVLLLVSGPAKRSPLRRVLEPSVSTHFPASLLWLHADATVVCDQAALGPRHRPKRKTSA